MCDPILATPLKMQPHYSQSSRENATPSSGTSPSVFYKEVPPPGQGIVKGKRSHFRLNWRASLKNALWHWFLKNAPTWDGSYLVWARCFCWPPPPPPENLMGLKLVPKTKMGNFLLPFFTIQLIKMQDCVICILQLALAWHASHSFPEISTVGRTRTVIYVYIRLTDTPFYYFIVKIIKKHQPFLP